MDNLKEIIEAEVESKYRYDGPHVKFASKEGCNFMAGHLEKEFNELRAKIAGDAFEAGYQRGCYEERGDHGEGTPSMPEYLSSLNSKENE